MATTEHWPQNGTKVPLKLLSAAAKAENVRAPAVHKRVKELLSAAVMVERCSIAVVKSGTQARPAGPLTVVVGQMLESMQLRVGADDVDGSKAIPNRVGEQRIPGVAVSAAFASSRPSAAHVTFAI